MRRTVMMAASIASVLSTSTAYADDELPPPVIDDAEIYPGRIIAADAGSLASFGLGGLVLVGVALGGGDGGSGTFVGVALVAGGIVGYTVGPPLLHVARGNPRGAMRSAVVRAGFPLVGAMLAYLTDRGAEPERVTYGLVGGIGVAMLVDWTLLARMPMRSAPFVVPMDDGGVQAGIAGRF